MGLHSVSVSTDNWSGYLAAKGEGEGCLAVQYDSLLPSPTDGSFHIPKFA